MKSIEPTELSYPNCLFRAWKGHLLRPVWIRMYRGTFGLEDLQRRNQEVDGYGFAEWFTSVYFHLQKYTVIRGGYFKEERPNFPKALAVVGANGMQVIQNISHSQPPDLLVVPTSGEFFFVEAKRGRDSVSKTQATAFSMIEEELKCRVKVVHLSKVKKLEDSSMPEECMKAWEECEFLDEKIVALFTNYVGENGGPVQLEADGE